jgi:hypothetical protein
MCELQADEQVAVIADGRAVLFPAACQQVFQGAGGLGVDQELARVRASFRNDSARFTPDQLGSPGTEPEIPPHRQLAGFAVEVGVAPLHRLDRQPIPHSFSRNGMRRTKDLQIVVKPEGKAQSPSVIE